MKSPLTVTFLGTGTSQGIPIIGSSHPVCLSTDPKDKRLRVSVLIEWDDHTIVVDCGPDFRQQMLRENVQSLDAVLLTHEHNDHIIGLDDVRPFNFKMRKDMPVFATARVGEDLRQRFAYIFAAQRYPGAPMVKLETISKDNSFVIDDLVIQPIEVIHGKLPILGFRFGSFTYLTDVKTISVEELEKIKGTRYLVLNALHHTEHYSHLNLTQALELAEKIQPEHTYLTHISHRMGKYQEVSKDLPEGVQLAYDGLVLTID